MERCDWVSDTEIVVDNVGVPVKAELVEMEEDGVLEKKGLEEWEVYGEWEGEREYAEVGLGNSEVLGVGEAREVRDKMGVEVTLEVRMVDGEVVKDAVIH